MTTMPSVAVVTVVHGRHQHLHRQQRTLSTGDRVPEHWVVVAMEDEALSRWRVVSGVEPDVVSMPADPDALPLAAARNCGAAAAMERGAGVLVFLDVDCLAGPSLVRGYADVAAASPRTVWSGPVTYLPAGLGEVALSRPWDHDDPHPARPAPAPGEVLRGATPELFWSLSFAMSAAAWSAAGGFDEEYIGYGGEDTDFALQCLERDVDLAWVGDARAYHQHHPISDPPVEHLDAILANANVFHRRWGRWPMEGWLHEFRALDLVEFTQQGWVRTTR